MISGGRVGTLNTMVQSVLPPKFERGIDMTIKKQRIDLGLTITIEYPESLDDSVLTRIFDAVRGKGDIRRGINMNANIGHYVANKLKENMDNAYPDKLVNIKDHGVHIKREENKL